ncbi:MAG TPA: hypothetical protein VFH89_09570 [Sphingomicrobium sp.]|nr:hypothetical protein [Sphingomicrobium sp.]
MPRTHRINLFEKEKLIETILWDGELADLKEHVLGVIAGGTADRGEVRTLENQLVFQHPKT